MVNSPQHLGCIVRVENTFLGAEGVGNELETRLWESGVTRWDAFDGDCRGVGPTRSERIERYIERGRDALGSANIHFFDDRFPTHESWRLYESFEEQACFFDIETTGLDQDRNVVTTVTLHQGGNTQTLVRGDDLTSEELAAVFESAEILVTFNGARFDIPFLEANFDIDLDRPHIDLLPTCRRAGLEGGLSGVEDSLDIGRDLPDVDGREAVRLWQEHERGVDGSLDRLIAYNREDTENMVPVLEETIARLDTQLLPE